MRYHNKTNNIPFSLPTYRFWLLIAPLVSTFCQLTHLNLSKESNHFKYTSPPIPSHSHLFLPQAIITAHLLISGVTLEARQSALGCHGEGSQTRGAQFEDKPAPIEPRRAAAAHFSRLILSPFADVCRSANFSEFVLL